MALHWRKTQVSTGTFLWVRSTQGGRQPVAGQTAPGVCVVRPKARSRDIARMLCPWERLLGTQVSSCGSRQRTGLQGLGGPWRVPSAGSLLSSHLGDTGCHSTWKLGDISLLRLPLGTQILRRLTSCILLQLGQIGLGDWGGPGYCVCFLRGICKSSFGDLWETEAGETRPSHRFSSFTGSS